MSCRQAVTKAIMRLDTSVNIIEIKENKKRYIDLLLLADEQEEMVDRYLESGTMYALVDEGVKAVCVVTDEGDGVLEIKNLAVSPAHQGKGYGRTLIDFVAEAYEDRYRILQVGTGDSPLTVPFSKSADLLCRTVSKTSLQSITTILLWNVACSLWIWCT